MTEIKQLNECAKDTATLAAYLLPTYIVKQNNGISPRTPIGAGAITYVQNNSNSEPAVQMLELSANGLEGLMVYQQQLRQDIRETLFIPDLMVNISKTASELNDKINQLDTDLLAVFSSFQNELVYNFVNTVLHLAIENKIISKIKEKNIYYNFDNQLTKVFKKNLPQLFTSLQIVSNIDPNLLVIKKKELSRYIMDGSAPVEMLNTVEEQTEEEQRLLRMAQNQQQQ